jgi:hypothetical protein
VSLASDVQALGLRNKANDVIRAIDEWRDDGAHDKGKALDFGLQIAEEVSAMAGSWSKGLDAMGGITGVVNLPAVGDNVATFKKSASALGDLVTVAQVSAGGLTSKDPDIRARSLDGVPDVLRRLMLGVRDVVRDIQPTLPLLEMAKAVIPDLAGPILELGKKLADALTGLAQWLRRAIAGTVLALLAIVVVLIALDRR